MLSSGLAAEVHHLLGKSFGVLPFRPNPLRGTSRCGFRRNRLVRVGAIWIRVYKTVARFVPHLRHRRICGRSNGPASHRCNRCGRRRRDRGNRWMGNLLVSRTRSAAPVASDASQNSLDRCHRLSDWRDLRQRRRVRCETILTIPIYWPRPNATGGGFLAAREVSR